MPHHLAWERTPKAFPSGEGGAQRRMRLIPTKKAPLAGSFYIALADQVTSTPVMA